MKQLRKLPLHYSLAVARKIVNKVKVPKDIANHCSVESWANCREQGLSIGVHIGHIDKWKNILVAQQRNSDDILIVVGASSMFDNQTNQPSDEIWDTGRTHFRYNEVDKAVRFIEDIIRIEDIVK